MLSQISEFSHSVILFLKYYALAALYFFLVYVISIMYLYNLHDIYLALYLVDGSFAKSLSSMCR